MICKTLGCVLSLSLVAHAADDPAPKPNPVDGKWSRTVETNNGPLKFLKEHRDGATTLEIFDANGKLLAAKSSNYRLTETDHVQIFTFLNNTVTAGPGTGQKSRGESSYMYRIDGDRFIEVHGLFKGTDDEFDVLIWERVPEEGV